MPSETNRINKEQLMPYFEKWESMRGSIEGFYQQKDHHAVEWMREAITNYHELLECGGKEFDDRKGKLEYLLLPLNGEERFEFVKDKIASHYAYVQLDALFTETKKKVARLAIRK
ncbi:YpoC family protein [Sporosarcina sp. NPDC096371]|uniref:YpoC family protein n=1 Tax=Sporosarcina sp. NPDC096371 TaxID=3364530 RepID=UPI003817D71E